MHYCIFNQRLDKELGNFKVLKARFNKNLKVQPFIKAGFLKKQVILYEIEFLLDCAVEIMLTSIAEQT